MAADERSDDKTIATRALELFLLFLVVVGALLIAGSIFVPDGEAREIFLGLGLGIFPVGVVTLLVSRFADAITRVLLTRTVREAIHDRLEKDMQTIDSTVKLGLKKIDDDMKELSPLFLSSSKFGLESVHLTRSEALNHFAQFVEAEVKLGEKGRVWIVGSSMKGLLGVATERFDGRNTVEAIVASACDLRIMVTALNMADSRATQEDRAEGDIPREIEMNLGDLKRVGVEHGCVKFYKGTPTVFAIATNDRMLLNPYPYETEAYHCFAIVARRTRDGGSDIFQQYLRYHFEEPWARAEFVSSELWGRV